MADLKLDYDTQASFYGVKKAAEPVHVQMNLPDLHAAIVNNTEKAIAGATLQVHAVRGDGTSVFDHQEPVSAPAQAVTTSYLVDVGLASAKDVVFVEMELKDAQGALLSQNFYWYAADSETYRGMNSLPQVAVTAKAVAETNSGGEAHVSVALENTGTAVAVAAKLTLLRASDGERILPAYYSDNYLSLLPGEKRVVEISFRDAQASAATIAIRGSNVVPARVEVAGQIMEQAIPSRTALSVALRRAAHQIHDSPVVFNDPLAVAILGATYAEELRRTPLRPDRPFSIALRAFLVARSRYAEDNLRRAVESGVDQYVLLGAGLDTFAYRNPYAQLRVFEVDHPATQQWKRELLQRNHIAIPESVTYTPVDFERQSLSVQLGDAGFNHGAPAFFAWLGVVPYLTLEAFRATLSFIAAQPSGSGLTLDYGQPRAVLPSLEQLATTRLPHGLKKRASPSGFSLRRPRSLPSSRASTALRILAQPRSTRATLVDVPISSRCAAPPAVFSARGYSAKQSVSSVPRTSWSRP